MARMTAEATNSMSEPEKLRATGHPNSKTDWTTYRWGDQCFKAAYQGKMQLGLHKDWGLYDDYWRSQQNAPENEDDPGSVTNIIHPVIEGQVADMVNDNVDFVIQGTEPSDENYAQYVKHVCNWVWNQNQMELKQDQHERQRLKYGTGIWKVYYDPTGNKGLGKICIDVVGPEKFFPDPKITSPYAIQLADFVCQPSDVSLTYLRKRFGRRAKYVRPRQNDFRYNANIYPGESIKDASWTASESATLIEMFSKDDEDRLRVIYWADDVILWDSQWPEAVQKKETPKMYHNPDKSFYEHGQYPYVITPCYLREGQVWGMGDVELLKPVQDLINDLDDQIRMNARLMGNIQIVVGLASGINPMKWTNKPALRVPARDPSAWKMVEPPNIPAYIVSRREIGKQEGEMISGRTDAVEGRKPPGIRAASAIIALQEAGSRRANHKRLMLQAGLSQVMILAFEFFKEFFTETMAIRITGEKPDDKDQFVWMSGGMFNNIEQLVPDMAANPNEKGERPLKTLTQTEQYDEEYQEPYLDDSGNYGTETKTRKATREVPVTRQACFDFYAVVGAGLPKNKSFLYQAVIELHREQLVTTQEARDFMKKLLDFPIIDPYNPTGTFGGPSSMPGGIPADMLGKLAQMEAMQGGGQQQPQQQGVAAAPNGMDPNLLNALAGMLGGV